MLKVVEFLEAGYIVVSKNHSEVGVEYLAPYRVGSTSGKLVVACVQCKFVQNTTSWVDIEAKMKAVTDKLRKMSVECFPCVYTT